MTSRPRTVRAAAVGAALAAGSGALAQDPRALSERLLRPPFTEGPRLGPSELGAEALREDLRPLEPGPALPQTLQGTVDRPRPTSDRPVAQLRDIVPAIAACWRPPEGLRGFERIEITARFSLKRDGNVIGPPRITFASAARDTRARELLTQAALDAIRLCTPLRLTAGLGGAVAGRPIAIRFIYRGPKGQGA